MDSVPNKSNYFDSLDSACAERYKLKISCIDNEDPYCIPTTELTADFGILPKITYPDLVNYLVYTKSHYTAQDFKAYKSLEAYNQFSCGWVRDLGAKKYDDNWLIIAKVLHSQCFTGTPLLPWVITDHDGTVLSGHCTCMAGLAEACTHIGALLFFVEFGVRNYEARTVTEEKAYWPVPSAKEVPYSRIRDIDFSSGKKKCQHLEESVDCPQLATDRPISNKKKARKEVPESTKEDIERMNRENFETGTKSAFLQVTRGYEEVFKSQTAAFTQSADLRSLHNTDLYNLTYEELIPLCYETSLTITSDKASTIEKNTRQQSNSKQWFRFRAGRITASKFKSACCTRTPISSPSLIKAICYPEAVRFKNKATEWGCTHEETARLQYIESLEAYHEGTVVSAVGLVINPKYPFFGATPDAGVYCDCCGYGILEIKCPYCIKNQPVEKLPEKNDMCLAIGENGEKSLRRDHAYFYQVQAQLFITDSYYVDFMVWSNVGEPHIERIYQDADFWDSAIEQATKFLREGILPELLAKFISRGCNEALSQQSPQQIGPQASTSRPTSYACTPDEVMCICAGQGNKSLEVIHCVGATCPIKWYHMDCLKLKRHQKKFICKPCRKSLKKGK